MAPFLLAVALALIAGAGTTVVLLWRSRPDVGAPQFASRRTSTDSDAREAAESSAALLLVGLILAFAMVGLGLLALMVERGVGLASLDDDVERWAAEEAGVWGTRLLVWTTQLGGTWTIVIVASATGVAALVRSRRWSPLLFLATVGVGQFLLSNLIKWLVDRGRPALEPLADFSGPSFPSGHTTAAASTYLAVALILGVFVGRRPRALLIGAAVAIAVAVGCSRALLGVHWLTDVLGGLLLGWSWFALCSIAFGGRRLQFGVVVSDVEERMER